MLMVACANVYGGCIAMARQDAVIQPNQFDPESEPDGRDSWRDTDSVAAAGRFRMVTVSEKCLFVRMCCYSYYHVANG